MGIHNDRNSKLILLFIKLWNRLMPKSFSIGIGSISGTEEVARTVVPYCSAHRAGLNYGPENLLSTVVGAATAGCSVEVDVRSSSQNTPYLMHDWDVARTTNGSGGIINMTDATINALIPDGAVGGEKVPTLASVLAAVRDNDPTGRAKVIIHWNSGDWTATDIQNIASVVAASTLSSDRIVYASWLPTHHAAFVQYCNNSSERLRFMFAGESWTQDPNATGIMPAHEELTLARVQASQAQGIKVHGSTSTEAGFKKLLECGVNSNMTDYPETYFRYLGRYYSRSAV